MKLKLKLKHLIPVAFTVLSLTACNNQDTQQWEYKIIQQTGENGKSLQEQANNIANRACGNYGTEAMLPIPFVDPTSQLNKLGEQGWELVNVYTTSETVFPNFGNAEYHTGVKENTRTQTINFVFKRKVK